MKTVRPQPFLPYVPSIFAFFKLIAHDANSSVKCFENVSSLIGDIMMLFPKPNQASGPTRPNAGAACRITCLKKCQDNGNALDGYRERICAIWYGPMEKPIAIILCMFIACLSYPLIHAQVQLTLMRSTYFTASASFGE